MKSTVADVLKNPDWIKANNPSQSELLCSPDCDVCGGVGFLRGDYPVGHKLFGKLTPCPKLPAESKVWDGCGVSENDLKRLTWGSIDLRKQEPDVNVKGAISELQKAFSRGRGIGYLWGGPGLAKTKLLEILCSEWRRAGKGTFRLITQKEILDVMRSAYDDDEPQRKVAEMRDRFIEKYSLLCIDEMTIDRPTPFGIEETFHLINKRHEAGTEKERPYLTIMTGNISPAQLDYRIADRLQDDRNFIFKLTGDSYRPNMHWSDQ